MTYATAWWNTRSRTGQGRAVAPPKWNVAKDWQPPVIADARATKPMPSVAAQFSPAGCHKKILRLLIDGWTWEGSTLVRMVNGKCQGRFKARAHHIAALHENGYLTPMHGKMRLTGKATALMGKGSIARIA